MKTNFKISQFSRFLLKVLVCNLCQILKMMKLLNSFPLIKKTVVNHVYIRIWSFWLTFTVLQWMKRNFKISQFSRFLLKVLVYNLCQILKMMKTFELCSTHQENTSKSCLHSNLTILTDSHSFTVNEVKPQN